jgi:hypothetical protein
LFDLDDPDLIVILKRKTAPTLDDVVDIVKKRGNVSVYNLWQAYDKIRALWYLERYDGEELS